MCFVGLIFVQLLIPPADEEDQADGEPDEQYMRVYRTKLWELSRILSDVYSPAEFYRINEKLNNMGRISVFVSNLY